MTGMEGCDMLLSWIMKVIPDGNLALEIFCYVDDGRATGHNKEAYWDASHRFASICTRLGVQDAARKRTFPGQKSGS